jgi:DNA repair protein RadD
MVGALPRDYVTIQDAAEYLGTSVQTLRRWDASGRLKPVRHPANGYRYYRRADLEPFRLAYASAEQRGTMASDVFHTTANIDANELLREPQQGAHRAAREHFESSAAHATIQMPVGCGKTGVIATLPFGIATGCVLVIAPNVTIRQNIYEAVDLSSPKCFWKRCRVLSSYERGPYVALLDGPDANMHDCEKSHFVVTNIQQLASSADRWLPQFPPNFFDMILVDEGHHNAAPSWRRVFERFPRARVVSLTATPFRSDQQRVEGEVIYRYPFRRAMLKGYIKEIHSLNVAPAEISFTYRGDSYRHTLEEVLALREEQWFRKGVALAEECNRHIVDASIRKVNALRVRTGVHHQIIAVACSVDHAKQVRSLYEEKNLRAREIHSDMEEEEREDVLAQLRRGRLDCIVQVAMLGEGFDHPPLSVAAVFRPFRSLSPYIQFVGRIMRVVHENEPGHADNHGFVVSHVGLNNDEHWEDFREFDTDDQAIFRKWIRDEGEQEDEGEGQGHGKPRRFDVGMHVDNEVLSHFIGDSFIDADDNRVIDEMLNAVLPNMPGGMTLAKLNVTREQLREQLRAQQPPKREDGEELPANPQRRRQELRRRLDERSQAAVARVLGELGVKGAGRGLGRLLKAPGEENFAVVTRELARLVNGAAGAKSKQRDKMSEEQLRAAFDRLDELADKVRDTIKQARGA